ncbi:MAG: hypothetical protein LC689_19645, partial [Myxococcales bacterium]|nr:hypothetical protein [Myxococcales bacterium]
MPGSVQTAGSETPVDFTVIGTDTGGHPTPTAAAGHGQLLIDDAGPTVQGVTIIGGVDVSGIRWFKAAATGTIDAQANLVDAGSGVDPASLTLVLDGTATRFDTGTPSCGAGQSAQQVICHFAIPLSAVPAGSQRKIQFAVAGADKAGNALKANTAAVGIDGKAPAITFTIGNAGSTGNTTTYPASFADCNGSASDPAVYCGHDGSHFYRAGDGKYSLTFTVSDVYPTPPDDQGSGVDTASGGCSIAGSTATCTVTYNSTNGTFNFPANFATATFASGADGTGTVSVIVTAKDAVGNLATSSPLSLNVTRLKWMRSMGAMITSPKGSPVVTSIPTAQVILAGTDHDALGPIASLAPDGAVLWRAGHTDAVAITSNVAYSSATKRLYMVGDTQTKLFVYDIGNVTSANAPQLYN